MKLFAHSSNKINQFNFSLVEIASFFNSHGDLRKLLSKRIVDTKHINGSKVVSALIALNLLDTTVNSFVADYQSAYHRFVWWINSTSLTGGAFNSAGPPAFFCWTLTAGTAAFKIFFLSPSGSKRDKACILPEGSAADLW